MKNELTKEAQKIFKAQGKKVHAKFDDLLLILEIFWYWYVPYQFQKSGYSLKNMKAI